MSSIVVADAGPLHYLALIDCAGILEHLFDHVLVPFAVRNELLHSHTPEKVQRWLQSPKAWLSFEQVHSPQPISGLHLGEAEALQLAMLRKVNAILMDDMDGRSAARELGFVVIGTLGLLKRASEKHLIDFPQAIARLRNTNIFLSDTLLDEALEWHRKQGSQ